MTVTTSTNPFRFGALALDEAFTDREDELSELVSDARNGQDVVVFAPRRYGKTSLVHRAAQELVRAKVLVAQVDLMTTPTAARFADKLARAIHDDIATPLMRAKERLRVFAGLRIAPIVTVDPQDGSLSFSFDASHRAADLHATIERLLELPAQLAGERDRRTVLVLDEFQEVTSIDRDLPRLMRAVFQAQPEVAHVYLGSRRHMMERIFSDANEPFWRSAKRVELDVIAPERFRGFIARAFTATGRSIAAEAVDAVLAITGGHPYATQELCYFLWQLVAEGEEAGADAVEEALAAVLRSENAHFDVVWDRASATQRLLLQALAVEPGRPLTGDYRHRRALPGPSTIQKALEALEREELVARSHGRTHISEPFLAEWVRRAAG